MITLIRYSRKCSCSTLRPLASFAITSFDGTGRLRGLITAGTSVWTSNLPPESLTELSGRVEQPALFIHADPGQGGELLSEKYYDAAKGPKELWQAPGGHVLRDLFEDVDPDAG